MGSGGLFSFLFVFPMAWVERGRWVRDWDWVGYGWVVLGCFWEIHTFTH